MFGKKEEGIMDGDHVFFSRQGGKFKNIIFAIVTGVEGKKIGVNGVIVNPVGLKNKIEQNKAGPRSTEIMENPTSENVIFAFIYRIEHENFAEVLDLDKERITVIHPKAYSFLDGWIRESLPELINNVLSLPHGSERDLARRILKQKMENLYDKSLKRNLYAICRSLKILI